MSFSTWSPFQSAEVKEICNHMTLEERQKTVKYGAMYGLWVALTFAGPIAFYFSFGFPLWALVTLVVLHVSFIPVFRGMQKKFVYSTEWAKDNIENG